MTIKEMIELSIGAGILVTLPSFILIIIIKFC